jgi:hypothetical protein
MSSVLVNAFIASDTALVALPPHADKTAKIILVNKGSLLQDYSKLINIWIESWP